MAILTGAQTSWLHEEIWKCIFWIIWSSCNRLDSFWGSILYDTLARIWSWTTVLYPDYTENHPFIVWIQNFRLHLYIQKHAIMNSVWKLPRKKLYFDSDLAVWPSVVQIQYLIIESKNKSIITWFLIQCGLKWINSVIKRLRCICFIRFSTSTMTQYVE